MQVINFKLLEKKILNKLNSPIVESNDNAVNLYDLNYAANEVLGKYNKVIYKETNKLKDSFNKLLSSENKRIQSVVPSILNSIPYIIITTSEHVNGKVYFSDILYTENSLSSKSAKKLFRIMNKFVEDLRNKSEAELAQELVAAKKELFNLRFQNATNQLDNTARIKEVRKNIARIQTVITEKANA